MLGQQLSHWSYIESTFRKKVVVPSGNGSRPIVKRDVELILAQCFPIQHSSPFGVCRWDDVSAKYDTLMMDYYSAEGEGGGHSGVGCYTSLPCKAKRQYMFT